MNHRLIQAAAVSALALGAASAQALTLNLTFGSAGSATATISGTAVTPIGNPVSAGAFVGSLAGNTGFDANPFYTYCVELTQWAQGSGTQTGYSIVSGASYFSNTVLNRLGKLFTVLGGANAPGSAANSAGIQMAVWESVYEGNNPLALGTGTFMASSGTTAAVTYANSLLSQVNTFAGPSLYSISLLKNANNQDFVLVKRIPEPGTLGLAALALAGIGLVLRRRA